jgi:hypothetical protein
MDSLSVGDKFETWGEFEEKLKKWRDSLFQPMFIHRSSRLIEYYNKNHPNCEPLSEKFKYFSVDILCIHSGTRESNAKKVN